MTNWLMVSPIHSTEIQSMYIGRPWPYKVTPNEKLATGDIVYLAAGQSGLYGWGYVTNLERYQDSELQREMMRVMVSRPVVREGIVSFEEVNRAQDLDEIMNRLDGNLVALTPKQVNAFNRLLRFHSSDVPSDVPEIQDHIGKFGFRDSFSFQPKLALAIETYGVTSVLFLDLDNFKAVNNSYDHATGDQVICEALGSVENAIQDAGEIFHRSGDEILVLLPNLNDDAARDVAERIRAAIEQKVFSVIGQGFVTITLGFATYPDTCDRWEDLENTADQTAMRAKKIRKNWVANCQENFDVPLPVSDAEIVDAQLELQRIDALRQGRPLNAGDEAKTKL